MVACNRENNFYKESWEEHFTLSMMGNTFTGTSNSMAQFFFQIVGVAYLCMRHLAGVQGA